VTQEQPAVFPQVLLLFRAVVTCPRMRGTGGTLIWVGRVTETRPPARDDRDPSFYRVEIQGTHGQSEYRIGCAEGVGLIRGPPPSGLPVTELGRAGGHTGVRCNFLFSATGRRGSQESLAVQLAWRRA